MAIPQLYSGRPAPVATYNWQDLVTGEGYISFYACDDRTGGSGASVSHFFLTTKNNVDAHEGFKQNNTAVAAATLLNEFDFDINIEVPMISGTGDAIFNATHYVDAAGCTAWLIVDVIHVRGAVETSIGTATTYQGVNNNYFRECLKIAITKKKFAIGDKLRLNIKHWVDNDAAVARLYRIYFDPASSLTFVDDLGRTIGTDMRLDMPFKVIL